MYPKRFGHIKKLENIMKEDQDYEDHFGAVESINSEIALRELETASIFTRGEMKTQQEKVDWLRDFFKNTPKGYRALYWRLAFHLSREMIRLTESIMVNLTVSDQRYDNKYFLLEVNKAIAEIKKAK